jgi:hypothetical protein
LTERLAQTHSNVTENSARISREREARHDGPVQGIRDYRPHQSPDDATAEADDRPMRRHRRRSAVDEAPQSRTRRKRR